MRLAAAACVPTDLRLTGDQSPMFECGLPRNVSDTDCYIWTHWSEVT